MEVRSSDLVERDLDADLMDEEIGKLKRKANLVFKQSLMKISFEYIVPPLDFHSEQF